MANSIALCSQYFQYAENLLQQSQQLLGQALNQISLAIQYNENITSINPNASPDPDAGGSGSPTWVGYTTSINTLIDDITTLQASFSYTDDTSEY